MPNPWNMLLVPHLSQCSTVLATTGFVPTKRNLLAKTGGNQGYAHSFKR